MTRKITLSLLLLVAGTPLAAQSPSSICWLRPGPQANCQRYLVTEAAVEIPIVTTSYLTTSVQREKDFQTRFTLSLGLMENVSADKAVGIVIGHDVNRDIFRGPSRAEVRVRKWNGVTAFDASAGLTRKGVGMPDGGSMDSKGLTAAIGGEWRYIGADARVDYHRVNGRTVTATHIGARATSVAAPVAALLAMGALWALIAATGAGY